MNDTDPYEGFDPTYSPNDRSVVFDPETQAWVEKKIPQYGNVNDAVLAELKEIKHRIATLAARPDNDTVFDPSALEARIVKLENEWNKTAYDVADKRISKLEAFMNSLIANLIEVERSNGVVSHKALDKAFTGSTNQP